MDYGAAVNEIGMKKRGDARHASQRYTEQLLMCVSGCHAARTAQGLFGVNEIPTEGEYT